MNTETAPTEVKAMSANPPSNSASNSAPGSTAQPPVNPARQLRKMQVVKIADYTPQIRELFIETREPADFSFRAGQFVMLHVPVEGAPKPALRAYSIASTDARKNGFRLVFKYVDGGVASKYVWSLKEGEMLDFTGPFGRVFFKEPPTEQIVMLNTGSGISQHFCFLESNLQKYPNLKYRLLFGVRHETDIYYREELDRLKAALPHFEYDFVLSRPTETWQGLRGYVQNHIDRYDYLKTPTTFYLCGNGAMIKDVKAKLAAEQFDASLILAEAFD